VSPPSRTSKEGELTPLAVLADDPSRVVTVQAQSGKSGSEVSISYTNCKVVGNGSFGVVFAAKMLGGYRTNLPVQG
jgi:glycogen synthase kinase 3 beta